MTVAVRRPSAPPGGIARANVAASGCETSRGGSNPEPRRPARTRRAAEMTRVEPGGWSPPTARRTSPGSKPLSRGSAEARLRFLRFEAPTTRTTPRLRSRRAGVCTSPRPTKKLAPAPHASTARAAVVRRPRPRPRRSARCFAKTDPRRRRSPSRRWSRDSRSRSRSPRLVGQRRRSAPRATRNPPSARKPSACPHERRGAARSKPQTPPPRRREGRPRRRRSGRHSGRRLIRHRRVPDVLERGLRSERAARPRDRFLIRGRPRTRGVRAEKILLLLGATARARALATAASVSASLLIRYPWPEPARRAGTIFAPSAIPPVLLPSAQSLVRSSQPSELRPARGSGSPLSSVRPRRARPPEPPPETVGCSSMAARAPSAAFLATPRGARLGRARRWRASAQTHDRIRERAELVRLLQW